MSESLRLLLLEDNPADAELNARVLRRSGLAFDLRRVEDKDGFLAALEDFHPHAILADFGLPRFDGLTALRLTRARDADLPFIFVTGALGEEGAVELLRNGASDYILKDRLTRLPDALARALETARQRAALSATEQALKASEERFRTLVETTLDWIWEVDAQGRYTYASPASLKLLGYRPDELLGRHPFDLMPPEEAARVSAFFAEIAETQLPFTMLVNCCLHRDGRRVVLETSGSPIFAEDGVFLGYRGVDRDITERMHSEAALQLQARRASALLELPRAADRMDEAEFMRFGQELAEALTESQFAFIHFVNADQDGIDLAARSHQGAAGDPLLARDDLYCRFDRAEIWADALRRRAPVVVNEPPAASNRRGLSESHVALGRLITLPVVEGDLVRMLAGVGNKETPYTELDVETVQLIANEIWRIVRQRRADQALRQSEAHLRTLVDTIPDLVWLKDPQGVYLACNPMFERVFGTPEGRVLGRTDYDLVTPDLADSFREHDRIAMAAGRPMVNEEWVTFADDGHEALLETIKTPMRDPEGGLIGVLGIARDITAVRQAQNALRVSEERFHALFENMRSGVCIYEAIDEGRDFIFRDLNRAVERIEDVKAVELLGRRVTEVFPRILEFGLLVVLERVWRTGQPEHVPPRLYRDAHVTGWRENFVYRLPHGEVVAVYEDVTERKTLELALEESRERLELALEGSELGMWDWDVPTGTVRVNARWAEMLGFDLNELEPISLQTWIDRSHPDDLALAMEQIQRHFRHEIPYYEAETRLRNKDGDWIWVLDRGKVVEWGADGTPIRMAGTHIDITARKQAEESLRKLSLAVEQSPASIVITDLEARIEYANPAFTRVSGYALDEAAGQNPRILQSGQTPHAVYEDLWATLGRGEVWRGEFRNRRKDGSEYVELATISPVRQPDGRVTHYLAVKEDISDLKRVEEELERYRLHLEDLVETRTAELRSAEERSRLILESSADGLYGVDTEGRATFINPSACAMLGYTPEQVLGRSTHDLVHHSHLDGTPYPREQCPVYNTLHQGRVLRRDEDVFWHADGHAFPVTYSSHPIYRDGAIIGAVISFFDMTAQKQAEAARELALAEAERLARLKSEFLANMSHEIRTPLNAVLGFAQIGARESDGRKARDFFRRILDAGQFLLGIVNDVLDFSKIEAGKLSIADGEVDLREVIERSADLLRTRARDKGLSFRVEEAEDLPASFRGDDLRLAQVLGNLLSNAIKFTEHGEVVFRIGRDADLLCFNVADTGIGLREDQLTSLFHPFEQADGSITRRFGGSGLGLAITKRLVEMMGGEIEARSCFGEGSRFEVRLPLIEPRGVIGERRLPDRAASASPASNGERLRGLRILMAEDNPANRLVLEEWLAHEGCVLEQVENGLRALERVREVGPEGFDLVLMDIQMPVMDGLEATRRILELAPALPIIGLTAHALQSERSRCLATGMVAHVAKPVDLDLLIDTILRHAPAKRGIASLGPEGSPLREPARGQDEGPGLEREASAAPWVDWAALAARYAHNPEFLPKLLKAILESNADQAGCMDEAIAGGDLERIAFIAHRLKGTAGNLFAKRFHQLASDAEESARAQSSQAPQQARRLAEALDDLLLEIEQCRWLREAALAAPGSPAAPEAQSMALPEVLARLDALLSLDDTQANELYDRYQAQLIQSLGEAADGLGADIKRFDYPAALERLRVLANPGSASN